MENLASLQQDFIVSIAREITTSISEMHFLLHNVKITPFERNRMFVCLLLFFFFFFFFFFFLLSTKASVESESPPGVLFACLCLNILKIPIQ